MDWKYVLNYAKHIRKMKESNNDSQARIGFIKGLIDKKTEDIIAQMGGKVSLSKKFIIKHQVEADLKKSISRVGLTVAALGLTVGIGAKYGNALTEKTNIGIEASKDEVMLDQSGVDDITIQLAQNTENTVTQGFHESLKVVMNEVQDFIEQDRVLRQNVEKEIDELTEDEEVERYLKEMYLENYNQENHTNYTIEDISIYKSRIGKEFDEDAKAENGDSIVRVKKARDPYEDGNMGLITVRIAGNLVEKGTVTRKNLEYKNVYEENESVLADKTTNPVGKVLSAGIDYIGNVGNTIYKNKLIDAVKEYRENQTKEIKAGKNNETAQKQDGLEER